MTLVFAAGVCRAEDPTSTEPVARFGTTVVRSTGFRGDIYFIPERSRKLPKFSKLTAVGSIYTPVLNVPPMQFSEGFPGVTGRFEWFAIDYNGRFWIETPGVYRFSLLSDDGAKLYVDGRIIVDNDGLHPPMAREGGVKLKLGYHRIRVSYFQGPQFEVALVLSLAAGEDKPRIFNMDEFLPPAAFAH